MYRSFSSGSRVSGYLQKKTFHKQQVLSTWELIPFVAILGGAEAHWYEGPLLKKSAIPRVRVSDRVRVKFRVTSGLSMWPFEIVSLSLR